MGAQSGQYSLREMMAVSLARQIREGMACVVGTGLPLIGATLAKMTHAKGAIIMSEAGIVDSQLEEVPVTVSDLRFGYRAACWWPRYRYIGFLMSSWFKIDLAFLGGAQIDIYGNLNSTCIDDYWRPKVRFTGSGGANGLAAHVNTVIIMRHEKRRFVPRVDYITSPGWLDGPESREKAGLIPDRGPQAVVTTLGVMRFDEETKRMYLAEYYPGVSVDRILEETGFELDVSRAAEAEPPSEEVLQVLRKQVDPQRLYT